MDGHTILIAFVIFIGVASFLASRGDSKKVIMAIGKGQVYKNIFDERKATIISYEINRKGEPTVKYVVDGAVNAQELPSKLFQNQYTLLALRHGSSTT